MMNIENGTSKSLKILSNADSITFANSATNVATVTENSKGDFTVAATAVGKATVTFTLTKGSKTQNIVVEINSVAQGSLPAEAFNTPKTIPLCKTNKLIQFSAELTTRYDDTTITDETAKPARVKDTESKIAITDDALTLTPGKYWNKQDALLKVNAKMGSKVESVELPIKLNYDDRELRNFIVSDIWYEKNAADNTQPFKYILDGTKKTGTATRANDNITVKAVNDNAVFDSDDNLVARPSLNPQQGNEHSGGGRAEFTATIPDSDTQQGFDVDFDMEVGSFYENKHMTADAQLNISNFDNRILTPDNSTLVIDYMDKAVGTHYVISMDPEIAYITHYWDRGSAALQNLDQRKGQKPYRGVITIHARKNGIARIAFIANSNGAMKTMAIKCIKCVGFAETVTRDKQRRPKATDKFLVLACLGQSNMVGFDDKSYDCDNYFQDRRLAQLDYWGNNLQPTFLLPWASQSNARQNKLGRWNNGMVNGFRGIHFLLAKKILDAVPEDYGILVVPVAHGNSAMIGDNGNIDTEVGYDPITMRLTGTWNIQTRTSPAKRWSITGQMYQMSIARIKHALSLNKDNKFLGLVWCQGETDSASYTVNHVNNWKNQFKVIMKDMETQLKDVTMFNGTKGFKFNKHAFGYSGFYQGRVDWPMYENTMIPAQKEIFGTDKYFHYADQPDTAEYRNSANDHHGGKSYDVISDNLATQIKNVYGSKFEKTEITTNGQDFTASLPANFYYLFTPSANQPAISSTLGRMYPTTNIPKIELSVEYSKPNIVEFDPVEGTYVLANGAATSDLPVTATVKWGSKTVCSIEFNTSALTNKFITFEDNTTGGVEYSLSAQSLEFTNSADTKTFSITTSATISSVEASDATKLTVSNSNGVISVTPLDSGTSYVKISLNNGATLLNIPVTVNEDLFYNYFRMSGTGYNSTYLVATGIGEKKTYFNLDSTIDLSLVSIKDQATVEQYVTFDFANKCFTYKKSQADNVGLDVTLLYNGTEEMGIANICFSSTASNNKPTNINFKVRK